MEKTAARGEPQQPEDASTPTTTGVPLVLMTRKEKETRKKKFSRRRKTNDRSSFDANAARRRVASLEQQLLLDEHRHAAHCRRAASLEQQLLLHEHRVLLADVKALVVERQVLIEQQLQAPEQSHFGQVPVPDTAASHVVPLVATNNPSAFNEGLAQIEQEIVEDGTEASLEQQLLLVQQGRLFADLKVVLVEQQLLTKQHLQALEQSHFGQAPVPDAAASHVVPIVATSNPVAFNEGLAQVEQEIVEKGTEAIAAVAFVESKDSDDVDSASGPVVAAVIAEIKKDGQV